MAPCECGTAAHTASGLHHGAPSDSAAEPGAADEGHPCLEQWSVKFAEPACADRQKRVS